MKNLKDLTIQSGFLSNTKSKVGIKILDLFKSVLKYLNVPYTDTCCNEVFVPDNQPKVYRALLTQSGTDAPVATVLENTIGDIVWSYNDYGTYTCELNGGFTLNKVLVLGGGSSTSNTLIIGSRIINGKIKITCYDMDGPTRSDDILSESTIEILVYP